MSWEINYNLLKQYGCFTREDLKNKSPKSYYYADSTNSAESRELAWRRAEGELRKNYFEAHRLREELEEIKTRTDFLIENRDKALQKIKGVAQSLINAQGKSNDDPSIDIQNLNYIIKIVNETKEEE